MEKQLTKAEEQLMQVLWDLEEASVKEIIEQLPNLKFIGVLATGYNVVDIEAAELDQYFPEFFKLKSNCKFHNCQHVHEPKCAVKKAVEADEIAASRYKSYIQILDGEDANYRTDVHDPI